MSSASPVNNLEPQTVFITGGASGIGLRMAERFIERGDRVAIADQDAEMVAAVKKTHPDALAYQADVTDEKAMDAVFKTVLSAFNGRIDVVCANAGTGGPAGRIDTLDYEDFKRCVSVNLFGAFLTARLAAKAMIDQEDGLIILTSSTSGLHGVPLRSPYVAAKWGLVGLTKTLAMELGSSGVRVNALAPGAVEGPRMETVLQKEAEASGSTTDEIRQTYADGVSLRSWVSADDVANMALFLASPAAGKITGQIMAIDGHTERMV